MSARRVQWLAALAFVGIVLAYGYWHAATHDALYIAIRDPSTEEEAYRLVGVERIALLDSDRRVLAVGASEPKHRVIHLDHPEVGTCLDERRSAASIDGRNAWQTCFAHHATWVVKWVKDVRYLDLDASSGCSLRGVPVRFTASEADWCA